MPRARIYCTLSASFAIARFVRLGVAHSPGGTVRHLPGCATPFVSDTLTALAGGVNFESMIKDLTELAEYLDKKFVKIDGRFASMDARMETMDGRVDRGFAAVDVQLTDLETQLGEVKDQVSRLYDGVDAYAKKADTYFQEMLMLANKVDRHEKWLHQVAEKLGLKLEY